MKKYTFLCFKVFSVALAVVVSHSAFAEDDYPVKPITVVIPFPPGGQGDANGRVVLYKLGEKLGQTIIVDNRPGASTSIGATYVANAKADGYTLLLSSSSTFTLNPAIRKTLPYDPVKSFDPIGMNSEFAFVLLANSNIAINTLQELIPAAKAAPEKYAYASFGSGTSSHFAAVMAMQSMGIKMVHVPYKGSSQAMTDLIGGQVQFSFDTLSAALTQLKTGKVKAIAVTSPQRSPQLPNVPTFVESGFPGVSFTGWGMLVAPKGVPKPILTKLENALFETMLDPTVKKAYADGGGEAVFKTSAQASARINSELPQMRALATRANISPD